MTTNTIAMYGDVTLVDVLFGCTTGDTHVRVPGAFALPAWRMREVPSGVAPITADIDSKSNSTGVSVPGCRGST